MLVEFKRIFNLTKPNGGRYTKHIYAGTQRIASKLGDIDAFGADPRRVVTAGHDVENIEPIDYGKKYSAQNNAFKARFDSLDSKFNGKRLDDYVNGQSFCCGDKNLDEIEKNNTQSAENAKLEDNLYFYHPDHLGSTSMVTNYDGEVTQNVAYIPYGEVFVEERNGSWATPFLFNAKELDEETGLYYYGARYLNPVDCRWLSPDPMQGKYPGMSPYNYCAGNPVKLVDPDGRDIINGHEEEYNKIKDRTEKRETSLKSKYGENFHNKKNEDFSSKQEYDDYKKDIKEFNKLEKKFNSIKLKYDKVNEYIENYKTIDPEGFKKVNNLTYKDNGEVKKFDIELKISGNLYESGGAKTVLCYDDDSEKYYSRIYLSSYFKKSDNHLAHEFGHNVQFSSDPKYWHYNTIKDLNCQENPNHKQAKKAIEWQERWNNLYNNFGR